MRIRVALVEDNPDIRVGTSYILRTSSNITCVGEFSSAEELIDNFPQIDPDIVIMDIGLPGMTGIKATEWISKEYPKVKIIMMSVFEDDDNVFRAICAGASGYVTKPVRPQQLNEAVEYAFGGGSPISPHIARKVLEMFRHQMTTPQENYELTEREREVLELLVRGNDFRTIAEKLEVSFFTVRSHIRNIYAKLQVKSKSQAVAKAMRENIVPP